jgi:hypothetical protein
MLMLLMTRTLNANQFCTLMHWISECGVAKAKPYGMAPGKASGKYMRHVDKVVGYAACSGDLYEMQVPGHGKHDLSRTLHNVIVLPCHEGLAQDMEAHAYRHRVREYLDSADLPRAYTEHPKVRDQPPGSVAPVALYIDAVPYSQTDSVIGFWLECMATTKRHLFAIFRKRQLCRCGCRGWCTFHSLFLMIRWCLAALAEGVWPDMRHDGQPWRLSDVSRQAKAGSAMVFKAACVFVKGDWAEYASTLGFPNWMDGLRPCFECPAHGADMYSPLGHTVNALRWVCNDDTDYEAACVRCEVQVMLSADTKNIVLNHLRWDKRKDGSHGRALAQDIPQLGLLANDRLEPCDACPDVGAFEELAPPCRVLFWRLNRESLAKHRNPLFCDAVGISPKRNLTIDLLHAFYLGVMNVWCRAAVWCLLLSSTYGNIGSADELLQNGVLALRHQLMQWYRTLAPTGTTRVSDLTPKMLGTRSDTRCKTKGAETHGMLLFLIHQLETYSAMTGENGVRLLQAGRNLARMVDIWKSCTFKVPIALRQDWWEWNGALPCKP